MSDSPAVTAQPPETALVPSNAYVAMTDDDCDYDDITPNVDRIQASGKDGRFYDRSDGEKTPIGETLRVIILHAPPSQTGWVPKHDPKKGNPPHPDLEFFTALGIDTEKPFCKNSDVKRQAARPSEDLTRDQLQGLRGRGWTGDCQGCPFKKFNRESKTSSCREGREVLLMVSGREMPARMTVDGLSLSPFKRFLKKEFETKGPDGKLLRLMPFTKVTQLSFKNEKNNYGDSFVLVPEASPSFLPEEQVVAFRDMRETYLLYTLDDESQQYVDDPVDHEISVATTTPATSTDDVPPPSDSDAPPTAAEVAGKFF